MKIKLIVFYATIFNLDKCICSAEEFAVKAIDCSAQRLLCYDCDSYYDSSCDDPFEEVVAGNKLKANHRLCDGCCLKHVHMFSNEERIIRGCSDKIVIKYFSPGCMDMGSRGVMCFCEGDFCNGPLNHTIEYRALD